MSSSEDKETDKSPDHPPDRLDLGPVQSTGQDSAGSNQQHNPDFPVATTAVSQSTTLATIIVSQTSTTATTMVCQDNTTPLLQ